MYSLRCIVRILAMAFVCAGVGSCTSSPGSVRVCNQTGLALEVDLLMGSTSGPLGAGSTETAYRVTLAPSPCDQGTRTRLSWPLSGLTGSTLIVVPRFREFPVSIFALPSKAPVVVELHLNNTEDIVLQVRHYADGKWIDSTAPREIPFGTLGLTAAYRQDYPRRY